MTARKIQILIVGPSSGSMIRLVVCHGEAPSMAAASRSSGGIPCRPASSRTIPKPMNCQVTTKNSV